MVAARDALEPALGAAVAPVVAGPEAPTPSVAADAAAIATAAGALTSWSTVGELPADALVVLVGPAGAGKSTWAGAHFTRTQVVSSDACRAMVADDPTDQAANADAFRLLHAIVGARLARGRLTVVDATNLQAAARRPLRQLAARHSRPMIAVVFQVPVEELLRRNAGRERVVPEDVVRWHASLVPAALAALPGEGYAAILEA